MRVRLFLGLGLLVLHSTLNPGTADCEPLPLSAVTSDSRIRLSAPTLDIDQGVGSMVEMRADSLLVDLDSEKENVWIPLGSLTTLEMAQPDRGRKTNAKLYGVVLGGVVGGAVGHSLAEDRSGTGITGIGMSKSAGAVFGVLAGMVIGGSLGAMGAAMMDESWVPIQYRGRGMKMGARIDPGDGAFTLSVNRTF